MYKIDIKAKAIIILIGNKPIRCPVSFLVKDRDLQKVLTEIRSKNITDFTYSKVGENTVIVDNRPKPAIKLVDDKKEEQKIKEEDDSEITLDRLKDIAHEIAERISKKI